MIVLMPHQGQAPSLDRIGDKACGAIIWHCRESMQQGRNIVTAQIGHQGIQPRIVIAVDQAVQILIMGQVPLDLRAPGGRALKGQGRIDIIGTCIDPPLQRLPARLGKSGHLFRAIFQCDHVPANGPEEPPDNPEQLFVYHPIQALPVVINHPPDIADVMFPGVHQGFIDIPLVQFRIAHQGDHAPGRFTGWNDVLQPEVILSQGCKIGDRRPQPDRSG